MRWLKQLDFKMKKAAIDQLPITIPTRYWSQFVRVSGAADQLYILKQLIAPIEKTKKQLDCLVVGVHGGRDYWGLKSFGHRVTGFDLGSVPDCPDIIIGNAEQDWPIANHSYDVIVMGEILEHLQWDMHALSEARRVLKPDGVLIVTVPYLACEPEYHVRLHDPHSIKRLLSINGFQVDVYLERPGVLGMKLLNKIYFCIAAPWYLLTQKSLYGALSRFTGKMEWILSQKRYFPRHLFRYFKLINWGASIRCVPTAEKLNYIKTNDAAFRN